MSLASIDMHPAAVGPAPSCAAIGTLAGAAGAMLLPPLPPGDGGPRDAEAAEAREAAEAAVRAGRWHELPPAWSFLAALARGETPETPGDPAWPDLVVFNAAVLSGDAEAVLAAAESLGPPARALAEAVAFRLGADAEPPAPAPDLDPRIRAWILATRAHVAAADDRMTEAIAGLREAADLVVRLAPAAAARLLGEAAALVPATAEAGGPPARTLLDLEQAAAMLEGLGFDEQRGELLMTRAELLMSVGAERPAMLMQAVQCLQKATQALPRRTHPVPYALCHLNVAVAYLSMPMSEHAARLRSAIAVQSLREALEVLDPADHPEAWQAATVNLANALQHLPSSHVEANLLEAVELYGQVLEHRPDDGPARGRLLANLGNALAHLGRLDEGAERLGEARAMLERWEESAAVDGVDVVLAEIETTRDRIAARGADA